MVGVGGVGVEVEDEVGEAGRPLRDGRGMGQDAERGIVAVRRPGG